jgi:hypothetical protein
MVGFQRVEKSPYFVSPVTVKTILLSADNECNGECFANYPTKHWDFPSGVGAALITAGIGVFPTPPLGMETSGRNHFDTAKNQSHVCLEFLSKKFKKDITDERGDSGDFKVGSS